VILPDVTTSTASTLPVVVEDDSPVITGVTDLVYPNANNDGAGPLPGGTGVFDYSIGADNRTSYDAAHSDFLPISFSGTVGSTAVVSPTATWASETTTSAVFNIS